VEFMFIIWEGGDGADVVRREEAIAEMTVYASGLAAQGKLRGGAPLDPPARGATVRKRRGTVSAVDGPYIETKEVVGGYFIVEAGSLEEAVELAKGCPAAAFGGVEVRPVIPGVH
jgi:hypothetical protein